MDDVKPRVGPDGNVLPAGRVAASSIEDVIGHPDAPDVDAEAVQTEAELARERHLEVRELNGLARHAGSRTERDFYRQRAGQVLRQARRLQARANVGHRQPRARASRPRQRRRATRRASRAGPSGEPGLDDPEPSRPRGRP